MGDWSAMWPLPPAGAGGCSGCAAARSGAEVPAPCPRIECGANAAAGDGEEKHEEAKEGATPEHGPGKPAVVRLEEGAHVGKGVDAKPRGGDTEEREE